MTNRHMKRCSTLYVIREFQSKRQTKYYYTNTMLLKLKTLTGLNADKDVEHMNSHSLLVVIQNGTATWEESWQFLEN